MIDSSQVLFVILLIVPAICYNLASFYNLIHPSSSLVTATIIAISFAIVEYVVKVPIIKFGHNNGFTPESIQICWIVLTLLVAMIISRSGIVTTKHIK